MNIEQTEEALFFSIPQELNHVLEILESQQAIAKKLDKIPESALINVKQWLINSTNYLENKPSKTKLEDYKLAEQLTYFHELKDYLIDKEMRIKNHAKSIAEKEALMKKAKQEAIRDLGLEKSEIVEGEFQQIHWTLLASPLKKSINSEMVLNSDGYKERMVNTKECLIGQTKGVMKNLEVTYDQEYVIEWIRAKLIKPLSDISHDDFMKLMLEAKSK